MDENRFRQRLLSIQSTAGWLTSFEKDSENENSLVNKISAGVSFMYHDSKDLSSDDVVSMFQNYFSRLEISQQECDSIERLTRGQAGNGQWNFQRSGRITSSNFGYVYVRKESSTPDGLAKRLFQYSTFDNKYVRWGRTHEPAARRMYDYTQNTQRKPHERLCVQQCGLFVNPDYPHLGASPDGLVFDPKKPRSLRYFRDKVSSIRIMEKNDPH